MKRFLVGLLVLLLLAANAQAATYSYGFGTDENPLSDSGAWEGGYTGFGNLLATGGVAQVAAIETDERMTVGSIAPTNDQYAKIKVITWNTPSIAGVNGFVLLLRWTVPATATGIQVAVTNDSSNLNSLRVFEIVNGSETPVGDPVSITVSLNDVFTAVIVGSLLTVYQNSGAGDVQIAQETVGGPSGGRIGLGAYVSSAATGDIELDDFEGGDYSAPPAAVTVRHRAIMIQ